MKKPIVFLTLSLFICASCLNEPENDALVISESTVTYSINDAEISNEEAATAAIKFLGRNVGARSSSPAVNPIHLGQKDKMYVVNFSDNKGFVILSGSKNQEPIFQQTNKY